MTGVSEQGRRLKARPVAALAAALALAACASTNPADPLEDSNRVMFRVNTQLDEDFAQPVARAYGKIPSPVRTGLRNFIYNSDTPMILVNDLLQGEIEDAGVTTARFVVNTTVGLGGLIDVATDWGLPRHTSDFGETLARWGVGEGPYIYWLVMGPSTARDSVGLVVDTIADPLHLVEWHDDWEWVPFTRAAIRAVDLRERLLEPLADLQATSADYYVAVRSSYLQNRRAFIRGEESAPAEDLPDLEAPAPATKPGN